MRATALLIALVAMVATGFGQIRQPYGQIRQRYHMRAEIVVSGTVGRVSANSFTLRADSGTYNVQVTANTVIATGKLRDTRGIVPGSTATVQGFPRGSTIVATRITVRPMRHPWHRIPPR